MFVGRVMFLRKGTAVGEVLTVGEILIAAEGLEVTFGEGDTL